MLATSLKNIPDTKASGGWQTLVYIFFVAVAIDAALLLSVACNWSKLAATATVFAAALITAGTLFTILQMFKLASRATTR